ncbi:Threonine--tRNA ligase [Thalassoglobus neptunius]|uniref:Threonine--tRNA ligase n=1 Tax=Thalassoglobus neptunius TaxID=1938619 RepID=A0A5C5WGG8_9PLAN|nr:threonine--tRNA ligase [Thalassoglobus neptunius]TWT49874.1 Threonine--tRNA ligase [Thalassoglobus neptunius]
MPRIQLPDGTIQDIADGSSALDVARGIGERLANATVAAEIDGVIVDAARPLNEVSDADPIPLKLLTTRDAEAVGVLRHSCAHVMARAVMRLFDGVGLAFGPTTGNGFYYDFDLETPISEEDFPRIEAEMQSIIKDSEPFERFHLDRDEAIELVSGLNQELKAEHIQTGLADHDSLSFYRQGEFVDLCRGPHIPDAGRIKAFKLVSIAGSYWKGDSKNKRLQRLYGTAFFDKKDMKAYLEQVDEAKRRDHRVLGKQHGLFSISSEVGSGLCLWLPKGATVRALLEDFIKQELLKRGYQPVYSPHIGRAELYETSGHFPYYRDSQFAPIFGHPAGQLVDYWKQCLTANEIDEKVENDFLEAAKDIGCPFEDFPKEAGNEEKLAYLSKWEKQQERYLLKPMNCPHHVQMYQAQPRSYRDLPVRLAEFGTVYRHEQSGELNGMLRVRGLTQDDAHLFCTPEQVEQEFKETLDLVKFVLASVGLENYRVQLSLRDPDSDKYVGSEDLWDRAEGTLRKVLQESGLEFTECAGEAAFYGPKADFMVSDAIGREWQLGTVQLDYNLPERFKLEYVGSDNQTHRPVMIHRAPFGSMERFVGMLIEHFAAAFPLWLAPEQIRILNLNDEMLPFCEEVQQTFRQAGFRTSIDRQSANVKKKIRDAQLDLVPYMLVVGPKDKEKGGVSVRDRIEGDLGFMSLDDAVAKLVQERDERTIRQVIKSEVKVFSGGGSEAENEY